jgi:Lrp/AsnC family transcriptional regulator, leucine-responsive regulatory protein
MSKYKRNENSIIDETDSDLIRALSDNARVSLAELGRNVGLSSPSVSERMRRLEDKGIIEGYAATINPRALGLMIGAWLRIKPMPGQLAKVAEILQGIDAIVECDRITGEDCFVAKAYVEDVEDISKLVDQIVPYAMTNTSIIQKSPVKRRLVSLPVRTNRRTQL